MDFVSGLLSGSGTWRFFNYDAGSIGEFIIAYKSGAIKVFGLDGTEYTVTVDSGSDYIPDSTLLFSGIDNDIYVVDPTVEVEMQDTEREYVDNAALVFLLGGQYGRTYEINVEWTRGVTDYSITASFNTPNGSTASHITEIGTSYIADQLKTDLETESEFTTDFDVFIQDDVLYIQRTVDPDEPFVVTVEDGDGGSNMFAVNNQQTDVGNIPRYAPHNYLVEITESKQTDVDNWYLEFLVNKNTDDEVIASGEGFGREGVWVETVAPNTEYQYDASTMPHVLVRNDDGTFTFREGEWADRAVGDDETNPLPSFVGNTINDLGAFQGRLVLLSDVNVIMSRTDKHTDFFNTSALSLNDDDPIDISSAIGTYVLKKLVPHNRDLVLFSDDVQFVVFGRNSLTPQNTSLVLTTEFEADLRAEPVAAGRNVFFAFKYGNFTGVQEFFTQDDINDARPVTQHVSQYIRGAPEQLISTTNFSKLIVRTDDDLKTIYVYEYVWLNSEKVQSSWSKWVLSLDVQHMFFVDNLLYMVAKDGDNYELYTLDLDENSDEGITYRIELDRKEKFTSVNTTFDPSYTVDDITDYLVIQGQGCPNPGMKVKVSSFAAGTVTLERDMGGGSVFFGKKYNSRYKPTMPFVRDRDGVKVGSGSLTIKQFEAYFSDTGYMEADVTDIYGYSATVKYTGRVIGDPSNLVGKPAVSDGSFSIPFKKRADQSELEIKTDSHLPLTLLEIEWKGQYRKRGRRITGG